MPPEYTVAGRMRKLPPLILHPFSDAASPGKLMQGSRANLMMQGLIPSEYSFEQLEQILLEGKVCEIRMLFYVGKDLLRWIEQCVEFIASERDLGNTGIEAQTLANFLIEHPPEQVREKLGKWGVQDYRSIFSRAIGLNAVFAEAPDTASISAEFIRNYHRYTDQMYATWQTSQTWVALGGASFDFDLFASSEYSRMLEREWSAE